MTDQQTPDDVEATDAAADLAAEHGIDLTEIEGTGADGRVTKSDVEQRLGELEQARDTPAREETPAPEAQGYHPKIWNGPGR